MDAHDLYREHAEPIERAIACICRRFRLSTSDAEDFAGDFRLRLVNDGYGVLTRFQGRSSIRTYLLVVVTRAFQDWRNTRWGKWRPSAEAKRLGPLAERIETLIVRDGHTIDEAHEILRTNLGSPMSRAAVADMVARFPERRGRTVVIDEDLDERPATDARPDVDLARTEVAAVAVRARRLLAEALGRLPAQDQLILRMRFADCLTVADIGRTLKLDQKPLYRRIEHLLSGLRRTLEAGGVTAAEAAEVLSVGAFDFSDSALRPVALRVTPPAGDGRRA
jgi:RNA polymerase sigma factor for flagellar operon FliA